ncbi:MAG: hypothetical protein LBG21_00405 [Campylobacteraceae bacterium]|jgi:hypothetical protein|nr:hypothetical protein [Campylobacteraceae bacterium]
MIFAFLGFGFYLVYYLGILMILDIIMSIAKAYRVDKINVKPSVLKV